LVREKRQQLNSRQKLFCQVHLERGFYVALRVAGYNKKYGYRLLTDRRIKEYILSLMTEALSEIHLTLGQLVKERHEMSNDVDVPAALRNEIKKELISYAMNAGEKVDEALKLVGGERKYLKPSKEIEYEEVENKDKGNGKNKASSTKEEVGAASIQGKADNGGSSDNVSSVS
jgi:hypothetical protein